jgi:hypothetical protein
LRLNLGGIDDRLSSGGFLGGHDLTGGSSFPCRAALPRCGGRRLGLGQREDITALALLGLTGTRPGDRCFGSGLTGERRLDRHERSRDAGNNAPDPVQQVASQKRAVSNQGFSATARPLAGNMSPAAQPRPAGFADPAGGIRPKPV